MTLLTHAPGPHSRDARPIPRRDAYAADAATEDSKSNRIARIWRPVLGITLMTVALAAIIALKASIYLARVSF